MFNGGFMGTGSQSQMPGGLLGGMQPRQPGLLGFLQSPQAMALAQSLLQSSGYSSEPQSFGQSLGKGFGAMQQRGDVEQEKLRELAKIELLKGHLDVDKGNLDVNRGKLELDKGKAAETLAERKQRREQLFKILDGTSSIKVTDEQKQRAATLAAAGYEEEAYKVLTEKAEKNPADAPTKATLTKNQGVVQAIDNIIPQIEDIIKTDAPFQSPNLPIVGRVTVSPTAQADYDAKIAAATDQLITAYDLPKTNESIHLMEKTLRKQPFEDDGAYKKRLEHVITELKSRRTNAVKVVPYAAAEPESSVSAGGAPVRPSATDLEFTAKKHGISVDEVIRRLDSKRKK